MRKLYALLAALSLTLSLTGQTARVQVIHNSPSPTVDVYANGALLLDDFVFRTATPFVDLPAGVEIDLAVAPGNSTSVSDAIATFDNIVLDETKTYVIAAGGIVGDNDFPFTLQVTDTGLEASGSDLVEVNVLHGSPGAPNVDVAVYGGGDLVTNLPYGDFSGYFGVPAGLYLLDVKAAGSPDVVATFTADLSGLSGQAITVFASGILGGDPAFGLFAALADGTVVELPVTEFARVQVIHNSPSPDVDVYANGALLLDDFVFRTATPFVDLPAGIEIDLAVAPGNSTSVSDAIATFENIVLDETKTYVIAAGGIVGDNDFPFTLQVTDAGLEASGSDFVQVNVLHGSPGAPNVDVSVRGGGDLVTNLAYGNFSGYLGVPAGLYLLEVKAAGSPDVVATFTADLSGLSGQALTVFASGILGGAPAFGLFAALADGTIVQLPVTEFSRVQVIHNSPSPTVDVYANGALLLDDFVFRTATPFVDLPAGIEIDLAVAPGNSTSVSDAIATFENIVLDETKTYVIAAGGIVGDNDFPFTLQVTDAGLEASGSDFVQVNVLHGSPGAPNVDVSVRGGGDLVTNLAYGDFSGYLGVPAGLYLLEVKAAGSPDVVATFTADLSALSGQALTVFASGILGGAPAFGLFAALADGTVVQLPVTEFSRVQVIHNSPSPTVDVYANGALLLDDFVFRTATPFVDLPAGIEIDLAVAPGTSTSVNDAIATFENIVLDATKTYVIAAGGIVGDNDFPFTLQVTDAGLEASGSDFVQVNVLHGSPGAPNVDVAVYGGGDLVTNLPYGDFSGYFGVPAGLYLLDVKAAGSPDVVATFTADLSGLSGQAITVFASGILGGDPAFGLFAALADGTVVQLPVTEFSRVQVIHNSPSPTVDVYANGALLLDDFVFRTATPFVDLPAGIEIDLAVAPGTSTSVNDAIATFENIVLDATKTYVIAAGGIVGDNDFPFTLQVTDAGLEASGSAFVQVNVLHGSPGAPNVDVSVRGGGDLVTNLAYGDFSGYLGVPAGVYDLDVKAAGSSTVVATFTADLSALSGQALTVFASGILGGDPAFGLFAALADGTVVELPQAFFARAQIVHNSPSPTVDVYANGELFINDFEFRTATPFVDLPAGVEIDIAVALGNSTSVDDALFNFDDLVFEANKNYVIFANGIAGDPNFPFTLAVTDAGREEGLDPDAFDVSVFHGSPGAPPVDVFDFPDFQLVDSLAYGNFTPYASLPVNQYILDVRPEGTATTVGYFLADVTDLGGSAGVIFASGQLGGDPGFDLLVVFPDGTVGTLLSIAPVQIIHNSPSPLASTVDIWVNNAVKIVEDLSFRNAEPFTFYPARFPLTFGVAAANSQTPADILINAGTLTLEDGKTYTVIANGIPGNATYPFELAVNSNARIFSESDDQVDVAAFHGSPGAPNVDVDARGIGNLIDNLAYGDYSGYLNVDPDQYFLEIRANGSPDLVGTFVADLSPLAGLSTVVFASGQLGQDPAFGLFAALPNGTVVELTPVSRVQIIHNSPEPTVDLYIDGELAVDDLAFREATPFLDAETRIPYEVAVAPANSQSVADAIATFSGVTFEDGKSYVVFATGVVGNATTPFDLRIFDAARERSENPDNVDILLYHGAPDAPEVDVVAVGVGVIFDNIAYGEFSADYLSVPAATYTMNVTPSTDNTVIVKSYTVPLGGFAGGAGVAFATGFLADEPAFGVWVALPDGTTFPLSEIVASDEAKALLPGFRIMPNPVKDLAQIELTFADAADNVSLIISDATGKTLQTRTLGNQVAGTQTLALDATNLAQGVHFCTIVTEKGVITKRFVVTR